MLTPRHCTGTCTFKPPLLPPWPAEPLPASGTKPPGGGPRGRGTFLPGNLHWFSAGTTPNPNRATGHRTAPHRTQWYLYKDRCVSISVVAPDLVLKPSSVHFERQKLRLVFRHNVSICIIYIWSWRLPQWIHWTKNTVTSRNLFIYEVAMCNAYENIHKRISIFLYPVTLFVGGMLEQSK